MSNREYMHVHFLHTLPLVHLTENCRTAGKEDDECATFYIDHRIAFMLEGLSGDHLVWPYAQSSAVLKVRSGCPWSRPFEFWKSLRWRFSSLFGQPTSVLHHHHCEVLFPSIRISLAAACCHCPLPFCHALKCLVPAFWTTVISLSSLNYPCRINKIRFFSHYMWSKLLTNLIALHWTAVCSRVSYREP